MDIINFNGWEINIESNFLRPIFNERDLIVINKYSDTVLHMIANEFGKIEIIKSDDSTKIEFTLEKIINIYDNNKYEEDLKDITLEPTLPDVTNFSDIFLLDSDNSLDNLSNIDKVELLINSSSAPLCDSCLSKTLKITPVNQLNQICNKLYKKEKIFRTKEICPICQTYRLVNRKR
ncbi:MAG: hypothetical protein ACRC41_14020 [Sarcina sp.]